MLTSTKTTSTEVLRLGQWAIGLATICADQISKWWVSQHLLGQSWAIHDMLNLTCVDNRGAAFGFLAQAGGWQRYFFILTTFVALGYCFVLLRRETNRLASLSIMMIIAGSMGNLIDRLRTGTVIDFIDFHWQTWHFPTFNIADAAISIGACCFFYTLLFKTNEA